MIRDLVESDLPELIRLGSDFDQKLVTLQKPLTKNLIFINESHIIGFINYALLYDLAELDYIYVKKEFRNTKIGTKLLENMIETCKTEKIEEILLEVRRSNQSAISFYEKHGFRKVGIRKEYYGNEDALVLGLKLVKI